MKTMLLITATLFLTACGATKPHLYQDDQPQRQQIQEALLLLQNDKLKEATDRLTDICNEPGTPGVTDEALFHLALLQLNPEPDKIRIQKARAFLKRLQEEFPTSPWAAQARHFERLIVKIGTRIDEAASLKRDLQKLKRLDLELERNR